MSRRPPIPDGDLAELNIADVAGVMGCNWRYAQKLMKATPDPTGKEYVSYIESWRKGRLLVTTRTEIRAYQIREAARRRALQQMAREAAQKRVKVIVPEGRLRRFWDNRWNR